MFDNNNNSMHAYTTSSKNINIGKTLSVERFAEKLKV